MAYTCDMDESVHGNTDADLLSKGDSAAFGELYDRHSRAVLRFLYQRTADPETAADLAAETFAQAYLSRRRYSERGTGARSWLIGIASHQLSRMLRKARADQRARRRLGMERIPFDEISYERIEELVDFEPLREAVREAMSKLSTASADAVALRIGEDLPYAEVAKRLRCTEAAARVRVARGLARLNELMEVSR